MPQKRAPKQTNEKARTGRRAATSAAPTAKAPKAGSVATRTEGDAEKCVRLRDSGMSWANIGKELGLTGANNGAGKARALFNSTGRDHRESVMPNRTARVVDPNKPKPAPKAKAPTRTAVKAAVRAGSHAVIPEDTPDAEIGVQLEGRLIRWSIDVGKLCGGEVGEGPFKDEECYVHPSDIVVERDEGGRDPYIHFREGHPVKGEGLLKAAYRTVRLSSIHYIGG